MSSSILSWQILTAHAQPFRGAMDLAFYLKVPLHSLLVWARSGGSGETARMRRLARTFAARIGDKYQIRFTRFTFFVFDFITTRVRSPTSRFHTSQSQSLKGPPRIEILQKQTYVFAVILFYSIISLYIPTWTIYMYVICFDHIRVVQTYLYSVFSSLKLCFSIRRAIISAARFLADILTDTSSYS